MPGWLTPLRLRLRSLFRRSAVEQELDEELRYHLEREIEARLTSGLTPEDARQDARRAMGAIAQNMEACRDVRRVHVIEHGLQDLRFAFRLLVKSPVFACTAVFVLALGICANVAIFGFVEAALIRPLPYADQSRLVELVTVARTSSTGERGAVSYVDLGDWKRLNQTFASIDGYDVRNGFTLNGPAGPARVSGAKVTAGIFRTLGVTPVLGRDFRDGEDSPSAQPTVVLSFSAWQARFGGRPDVLGKTITLDGDVHVIIGVLPRSFYFAPAEPAELWAPIRGTNACWQVRGCHSMLTVARLREGVTLQAAVADMKAVARRLEQQYPDSSRDKSVDGIPLRDAVVADVRLILLVLLGGAGLLLLIACVNVASLLLSRSDSRMREIAVRRALGASSARLLVQFAAEALVLVTAGTALGLIASEWGMRFLVTLIPAGMMNRMPYLQGMGVTVDAVIFAAAVSAMAVVLFTLTPFVRVSRSRSAEALKEDSRGSAGKTWRRLGANLVVVELAMAVILLVSAGLLGKSLYQMLRVDTGVNPDRLSTLFVGFPPGMASERAAGIARQVLERVATLPGVQSAGFSDLLPLSHSGTWPGLTAGIVVEGQPDRGEPPPEAVVRSISPGFFAALQAPLLRGRDFTQADDGSRPPVAIINQTMAEQRFGGEDPIGKRIIRSGAPRPIEIVGVVTDIQEGSLDTPARPVVYAPFAQRPNDGLGLVVRTSHDARAVFPSALAAIREVRADLLLPDREVTMTERINLLPSAFLHRSSAWLVGSFAAIAFLLSVVGLYGVVSYSVGQRTREIGVRIALGAPRRAVYRLVLGDAARLVVAGTVLGIMGSVAAARLMRGLLFGVEAWDVPTLAAVAAVLVVSAMAASYIPARRAASVNPIEVLRAE